MVVKIAWDEDNEGLDTLGMFFFHHLFYLLTIIYDYFHVNTSQNSYINFGST